MATTNKKTKLKEPVRIRTKKLADGSESYYLDIYTDGKRSYEFLKLYRLPEINARVKEQNKATLAAVETIKSQRIIELTHNKAGLKNTSTRSKILLTDWMQTFYDDQKRRGVRGVKLLGTVSRLISTYIGKNKVRMGDIDKGFCIGFIRWLQSDYKTAWGNPLSPKSMSDYVGYFSTALNAAVRADIIPENPFMSLTPTERIKVPESKREFLTVDEIKTLIATECPREDVKRAYLFACYCGLRLSDVYALKWKDLSQDGEQWRASVVMQKTTTPIFLPLSGQAVKWLPERGEAKDDENVFEGLIAEPNINKVLAKWTKAAGITKKITYHTSRHTFATMMLTLGADLYTTSKLLGHSNVKTTQIYAKIVDSKKVEAVNLVDNVFD
jgi:integrase